MVSLLLVEHHRGIRLLKMIFVEGIQKLKYLFVAYVGVLFDLVVLIFAGYQLSRAFLGSWMASAFMLLALLLVMLYLSYVRIFLVVLGNKVSL